MYPLLRMARSIIVTIALIALAWPSSSEAKPFRHEFGETREYHKHWLAVCPDEVKRGCRAVTATHTSEDGFFLHGRLAISQHWQTNKLHIQFIDEDGAFSLAEPVKVKFSNGKVLTFDGTQIGPMKGSFNELEFKTTEATQKMLKHMRARNHMTVFVGKSRYFYSLMGVRSAMRFMKNHKKSLGDIAIHRADFWSGEWPNGFTVLNDVKLVAQETPSLKADFSVPCKLQKGATYHPWNHERVNKEKLKFLSYQEIENYRIKKNTSYRLERYADRKEVSVKFRKNDHWKFLAYFAEGLFLMSYKGQDYVGDQSVFEWSEHVNKPKHRATIYEEWLGLPCDGGKRGWMHMTNLQGFSELGEANIVEFGNAKDASD